MTRGVRCVFLTHPEVAVDPAVPVPQWRLSERGRARARAFGAGGALSGADLLVSSEEAKAVETATVLAEQLALPWERREDLGENDRSSTGFLPPAEFERAADAFFAHPARSVSGWETADHAQQRIMAAVRGTVATRPGQRIAFVAHGGVGTLLLCSLLGVPISREHDQPRQGCWYAFDPSAWTAESGWQEMPG